MSGAEGPSGAASTVNVFLTGQSGIGKTTLILGALRKLPPELVSGFYTVDAISEAGERLGLDVITISGDRSPLCRLRRGCGPKVGKYYVAVEEFERVVLPHLMPSASVKLYVIDEVFGSLPSPRYNHILEFVENIKLRPDTVVLTLTKANRDSTAVDVEALLTRLLSDAFVSHAQTPSIGGYSGRSLPASSFQSTQSTPYVDQAPSLSCILGSGNQSAPYSDQAPSLPLPYDLGPGDSFDDPFLDTAAFGGLDSL
eukprot:jgi/Mesen1/8973/ME000056S08381